MLTTTQINAKRRRKEIKRQAKRRKIFLHAFVEKRNANIALKKQAMKVILSNPELTQKFIENQSQ